MNADKELNAHLRHGRKPYRKRKEQKDRRGQIVGQVSIDERPAIVDKKSRIGDMR